MKYCSLFVAVGLLSASLVLASPPRISAKQAARIALAKFPHGKLVKTPRLEKEDGQIQYEVFVRVGNKLRELNVNAKSGKITSIENVTASEEANEGKEKE